MRSPRTSSPLAWTLALCLSAGAAPFLRAQERSLPEAYGNQGFIASYPASGFTTESPTSVWVYDSNGYRFSTSPNACFLAPVQLPSGIKILALVVEGCDSSAANNVSGYLFSCPSGIACLVVANASSSGTPGCTQFASGTVDVDVNNMDHSYFLRACNFSSDDNTKFRTLKLLYQLQLSPAPATATFADVPTTHLYFRAIEALAKSGITSGCGDGNFCPSQAVTRGEVAKFLAVALGLSWAP
jgi:hypothetical protein